MTYEEALKITRVNKKSKFRIIKINDLKKWEKTLDIISECLKDNDPDIDQHYDCAMDIENISHDIMSIRL